MGSVIAVLGRFFSLHSNSCRKYLRMKAVVLGLVALVVGCYSAGIPVVKKIGHGMGAITPPIGAAGGFKTQGVFAGPFFAAVTTVVGKTKVPTIVPVPFIGAPVGVGGGEEGICQPVSGSMPAPWALTVTDLDKNLLV